jgi:hypothetical protein
MKNVDGDGGGNIIGQGQIHPGLDQLSRLHRLQPGVGGQDLFRNGLGFLFHRNFFMGFFFK